MPSRSPDDLVDDVVDQDSFIAFLMALADDFARERMLDAADPPSPYAAGQCGWEHGTVDGVFEAAASWGDATRHRWPAEGDANIWSRCARILLMGKRHE